MNNTTNHSVSNNDHLKDEIKSSLQDQELGPNATTLQALLDAEQLLADPETKRYADVEEILRELKD
jgi:hypothetical protein